MVDRRQWSDVTQQNRILLLFYDGVEITSEAHNLGGGSVDHEDGILDRQVRRTPQGYVSHRRALAYLHSFIHRLSPIDNAEYETRLHLDGPPPSDVIAEDRVSEGRLNPPFICRDQLLAPTVGHLAATHRGREISLQKLTIAQRSYHNGVCNRSPEFLHEIQSERGFVSGTGVKKTCMSIKSTGDDRTNTVTK